MTTLDAGNPGAPTPEPPDTGDDHFLSMTDLGISLLLVFIIALMAAALGFRQAEATSRDEHADLKRRQERVARERETLRQQEGELARIRAAVAGQRDRLAGEHEQMQREQSLLEGARERVKREQTVLLRERDTLRETQVALTREREEARRTRERIVAERAALQRQRSGATQALVKVRQTTEQITNREARERDLLSSMAERFNRIDPNIDAQIDAGTGTLRFSDRILFASGDSRLTPQGQNAIGRIGEALAEILPCYTGDGQAPNGRSCPDTGGVRIDTVLIEGHTDRTGLIRSNWGLSATRAIETYFALTSRRPQIREIRNARGEPIIGVSGYGPDRPVDEENMDRNRRIDLRFVFSAPLGEEMKRIEETLRETLSQ